MDDLLSAIEERMESPTASGLAKAVGAAVVDGQLTPGTKLPPVRRVAAELMLSPTTVSAAWSLLGRSGVILTDGRRGTTVAERLMPMVDRYQSVLESQVPFGVDLSASTPDPDLLPPLTHAFESLSTDDRNAGYASPPDVPELVDHLLADWPFPAESLTMVDGAMDAMETIVRALVRYGDRVIVEQPTFSQLLDLLDDAGARVAGVPVDAHGLQPTALREALDASVTLIITQPRAQNPTGASWTPERAEELAAVIAESGAVVVEDDASGLVSTTPALSLGVWLPTRTLHVRSFSKSHGPDLRLAALSGPQHLVDRVTARRRLGQGWSSRLLQRLLLAQLQDPACRRIVREAAKTYAVRRTSLVDGLAARGVECAPGDGLNVWIPVHDETAALMRLASQGIGLAPGTPFTVAPSRTSHVRASVGLLRTDPDSIAEQIARAARTARGAH